MTAPYDVLNTWTQADVEIDGELDFAYPIGRTALSYIEDGAKLIVSGNSASFDLDAGEFNLSFASDAIVATITAAHASIPKRTQVRLQLNVAAQYDLGPRSVASDSNPPLAKTLHEWAGDIEGATASVAGKLAKSANLSDVANAATARANLGLAIGTNVQAWDADLDALAALTAPATKLAGIATGATANDTDANLRARSSHTGTQSADTLTDGTTNKAFLATERTKLAGIATGATANDTDANLKARANHTGTQAISTVTGLQTALDDKAPLASPDFTGSPQLPSGTLIKKQGAEGGELRLELGTSSTLAGDVAIDEVGGQVRIFENGGTARGGYFDLATLSAAAASNLLSTTSHTHLATGTGAVARSLHAYLTDLAVNVKDFGAALDGATADDTAFTNACARAAATGKALYIPASEYGLRLTSVKSITYPITIFGDGRPGVAGTNIGNGAIFPRAKGSWILIDHLGKGFSVQNAGSYVQGATFRDLGFYYPQPTPDDNGGGLSVPTPYVPLAADYCVYAEGNVTLTVQNVNFHNPSRALHYKNTGVGHLNIKGVRGGPITQGIYVENCNDTVIIDDVRWWQDHGTGHDLLYYMLQNKVGLVFGHVDGPMVSNYFDIYSNVGIRFMAGPSASQTTRAKFSNVYLDVIVKPIEVQSSCVGVAADWTNLTLAGVLPLAWHPGGDYGIEDHGFSTDFQIVNLDVASIGLSIVSQQQTGGTQGRISIHNLRSDGWAKRTGGYAAFYTALNNTLTLTGKKSHTASGGTEFETYGTVQDSTGLSLKGITSGWIAYTPTVTAVTGAFASTTPAGSYCKIGRTVIFRFEVGCNDVGTAADGMYLTLPFNVNGTGHGTASNSSNLALCSAFVGWGGAGQMLIVKYDGTTPITTAQTIYGTVVYESAN